MPPTEWLALADRCTPQINSAASGAPMAHLFTFTSSQFDQAAERPNPINPIGGERVLRWLSAHLDSSRFALGEPDAEDWGWYTHVVSGKRTYLLGASGEWGDSGGRTEWAVQLHLRRSIWEKLSGVNRLSADDPLSTAIEAALRGNPEFGDITVDRDD